MSCTAIKRIETYSTQPMKKPEPSISLATTTLLFGLVLTEATVHAAPIIHQITVQPIRICDDLGMNCTMTGFFEAETDRIWAQAGIEIEFLPLTQFNSSEFLDIAGTFELVPSSGLFHDGGLTSRHPDPLILNM